MPSLNVTLMKLNARTRFQQFKMTLPSAAQSATMEPAALLGNAGSGLRALPQAAGNAALRTPAAAGGLRAAQAPAKVIPTTVPPGLFLAASSGKQDVDLQAAANNEYELFIDQMCLAMASAFDCWRKTALFQGVMINGPIAVGGSITGPSFADFLKPSAPKQGLFGKALTHGDALASAIGEAWRQTCLQVRVPGLSWYPMFAAYPGPQAPPTPNLPTPAAALGFNKAFLNATMVKEQALRSLSGTPVFAAGELFTALCTGFESTIDLWLPSQMITNVLGMGPVPTFAPPYVPAGPVVGGSVIVSPGAFAQ